MTCAISGPSMPGPVNCWGAVNGTIATAGFEVACAGWGCAVSTVSNTTGGGGGSSIGQVVVVEAVGGPPPPPPLFVGETAGSVTTLAGNNEQWGQNDGVGTVVQFVMPNGVCLDGIGGLYVTDLMGSNKIRRLDIASRSVTTVAGTGQFISPYGIEVDSTGNVYVADASNNAIRMLSGAWVAGSTTGVSGSTNSIVGTNATFQNPQAVRADVAGGLLYVADTGNYQVRTIAIAGPHAVATLATLPD